MKINIVDTPGHSDFGGEVERALKMVDGVMLLVDASEGPLPQTRYVLGKALEAKLPPIVVINKIDRADARPQEVLNEIYDLFIDLDAKEDQLEFPVLYTNAKAGHGIHGHSRRRGRSAAAVRCDCEDDSATHRATCTARCKFWWPTSITATTWDAWPLPASSTARCGPGEEVAIAKLRRYRCTKPRSPSCFRSPGLKRIDITETELGDIVAVAGVEGITIGETITDVENPAPLPPIVIDEPTIAMHVHGEHLAVRRTRGHLCHLAQPARAAEKRIAHQRFAARGGHRQHRFVQGAGPRRTAAFDSASK